MTKRDEAIDKDLMNLCKASQDGRLKKQMEKKVRDEKIREILKEFGERYCVGTNHPVINMEYRGDAIDQALQALNALENQKIKDLMQRLNSLQGIYEGLKASNELNKKSLDKIGDKKDILNKIEFVYGNEAIRKGVKQLYHKKLKTIISIREKYTGLKPDSFEPTT